MRTIMNGTIFLVFTFIGFASSAPFLWGAATAAFQIEGAWNLSGKAPSIWDDWTHKVPSPVRNGDTADFADYSYQFALSRDVPTLAKIGFNSYRFSISWPRLLPNSPHSLEVNQHAFRYYRDLMVALKKENMHILATIFHWDLPASIGDYLHKDFQPSFVEYASVCFDLFGDLVDLWATFNEPLSFILGGYSTGNDSPPNRCSNRAICPKGNDSTEPYEVAHNVILAHAYTVQRFRAKNLHSKIGIVLSGEYSYPLIDDNEEDIDAVERHLVFQYAWFADVITKGEYPPLMRDVVKSRLPNFTSEQIAVLKDSYDFLGINYYSSSYVKSGNWRSGVSWYTDQNLTVTFKNIHGQYIGLPGASSWLFSVPKGFRAVLNWFNKRYPSKPFYVCENGFDVKNEGNLPQHLALKDAERVAYFKNHTEALLDAIYKDNVDVRGYFAWSLMDNFEWDEGYFFKFGMTRMDDNDHSRLMWKDSAHFWSAFIANRTQNS